MIIQENLSKYVKAQKVSTNPLIDEAPILFLGRTLTELVLPGGIFVFSTAILDRAVEGFLCAAALFITLPLFRRRFTRGMIPQFLWSLGLNQPKPLSFRYLFSFRRSLSVFGP